jgi:hypothetical protein
MPEDRSGARSFQPHVTQLNASLRTRSAETLRSTSLSLNPSSNRVEKSLINSATPTRSSSTPSLHPSQRHLGTVRKRRTDTDMRKLILVQEAQRTHMANGHLAPKCECMPPPHPIHAHTRVIDASHPTPGICFVPPSAPSSDCECSPFDLSAVEAVSEHSNESCDDYCDFSEAAPLEMIVHEISWLDSELNHTLEPDDAYVTPSSSMLIARKAAYLPRKVGC